ncbi:MAG: GNAT family N-acetyltransferase [Spirochaetia bacterium]|nr:GNAT family N-acetyltransferase [Spirochaetia bacterium]
MITEINKELAKQLISKYHYLGSKGFRSSVIYGLYINNNLIGCAVYHGVSAPETVVGAFGLKRNEQEGIWELGRLVLLPEYNGKNYGSHLVGKSLKQLRNNYKARAVISYADSSLHNGGIYKACNFIYCGMTTKKKDFYVNGVKQERGKTKGIIGGKWLDRPKKHRFIIIYDKGLRRKLKWEIIK